MNWCNIIITRKLFFSLQCKNQSAQVLYLKILAVVEKILEFRCGDASVQLQLLRGCFSEWGVGLLYLFIYF